MPLTKALDLKEFVVIVVSSHGVIGGGRGSSGF